jgi:hypothetical protein
MRIFGKLFMAGLVVAGAPAVHADSVLRFPVPDRFGTIPATSYDTHGRPNGLAQLSMTRTGHGGVRVGVRVVLDDGTRSDMAATLSPAGPGVLRLVAESARVRGADGRSISRMRVDHRTGRAECTGADGNTRVATLPEPDRVANVPMNLLFRPLVRGRVRKIRFQTLLCGEPTRIIETEASLARGTPAWSHGRELLEVRYRFDLGPLLSVLAKPFLTRVSFWFDPAAPVPWVAHRIPLYAKGPTVMVMRNAVHPADLVGSR